MPAEFVVAKSLREFARGRVVVPGWRYKAIMGLLKVMPQWMLMRAAKRSRKPRR
jgi:hypothetical protein